MKAKSKKVKSVNKMNTEQPGDTVLYNDAVAGLKYGDSQRNPPKAGDMLTIVHERGNKFDSNAIRLEANGVKLGYVKAPLTGDIHKARAAGRKIRGWVVSWNKANPSWDQCIVKIVCTGAEIEPDEVLS